MRHFFMLLCFVSVIKLLGQEEQNTNANYKLALQAYQSKDYKLANSFLHKIDSYTRHSEEHILFLEVLNDYELAYFSTATILAKNLVSRSKKPKREYYYLLAKCLHKSNQFQEAIKWYKKYLKEEPKEIHKIQEIKHQIQRAWKGLVYQGTENKVIVENLGNDANTVFDEFNPVVSVNHDDKIYFSSSRNKRNSKPISDDIDLYQEDIYSTELISGFWQQTQKVEGRINSEENDIIQDFNDQGRVAIIKRGEKKDESYFYVDSLDRFYKHVILWKKEFLYGDKGDKDLQYINDSTFLFSSYRQGGYGGYDVYVAFLNQGKWKVENLGPDVNSEFDEITPFLAKDGRTLFFASNNLESMGGFDLFQSSFDEDALKWKRPKNLSQPFNSGADDYGFRLNKNSTVGFFSSNRVGGQGGMDLYMATFGSPLIQPYLEVRTFTELKELKEFQSSLVEGKTEGFLTTYSPKPIFYTSADQILFEANKKGIEELISFLKTYPHLSLNINCHTAKMQPTLFDTYFTMQKAEEVVSYLIQKGINPQKITLIALGANYPVCAPLVNGQENIVAKKFNSRLDFDLFDYKNLPVRIVKDSLQVPINQGIKQGVDYYFQNKELLFRINFVQTNDLFKDDFIYEYDNPIIIKEQGVPYMYCIGSEIQFDKAKELYDQIRQRGFNDAKILAFYKGKKLKKEEITIDLLEKEPELKKYLLFLE